MLEHVDQSFFGRAARAASLIPLPPFGNWSHNQARANAVVFDDSADETRVIDRGDEASEKERAFEEDVENQRAVRTLPSWVHSLRDDEDAEVVDVNAQLLPRPYIESLPQAHSPHRNHMPAPKTKYEPGRKFDHARTKDNPVVSPTVSENMSRWRVFAEASMSPRSADGDLVDENWMAANLPDLNSSWGPGEKYEDFTKPDPLLSMQTLKNFERIMLKNAFVPLVIRLIVLTFVCTALGLGVDIYEDSNRLNSSPDRRQGVKVAPGADADLICMQQASTYMAFVVSAAAIIYLLYITWDEYFSPPLGLRSSRSKMRLLFLDLIFIVFSAANLSLAFNTLIDQQWSCYASELGNQNNIQAAKTTCVQDATLCERQRALCSILLLVLVAWLMTFALSTMRVVERISR